MILSAQSIRRRRMVTPFHEQVRTVWGLSYGLGPAGYDIRVRENLTLWPNEMILASSIEHVIIPWDILVSVCDKSSWIRKGVSVHNTILDPGFEGYITLELVNHTQRPVLLTSGMPTAQLIFNQLDEATESPYKGIYQNQAARPQQSKMKEVS